MAFSLKKQRRQSKLQFVTNGDEHHRKELGAALHRSTKTKKHKKKSKELVVPEQEILLPDSDIETNLSSTPYLTPIIYRSECLCDTHYDKQLLENNYQLTVDKLFDLIFGTNDFVRTYRRAQRFYDETATEWLQNESTNYRERTLKYKVPYESAFFGKGTIYTREKQTIFHEVPGSHYTIETDVYNEGIKFSDTFSLIIRYCLVQISSTTTHLRVTAQIIYHKSVNGLIKQFIERNAYSASQEGLKDLNNRLHLIENFKIEKRHSSKDFTISSTPTITQNHRPSKGELTLPVPTITQNHYHPSQPELPSSIISQPLLVSNDNNNNATYTEQLTQILIFLIITLFFINLYLYVKLKHTDELLEQFIQSSHR